ncbi:MAG TPA: AMIN domain-containing protein, partial [Polyangiaceae bacterium]|nr:AMIN domain-containing protein [Polyangiaceae bacterium]
MRFPASRLGATVSLAAALAGLATSIPAWADVDDLRHATAIAVVKDAGGGATVRIEFSSSPTYTARLERAGRRLVIDVPNAGVRGAPAALTDTVGVVAGVLAQAFKTGAQSTTRILVTLTTAAPYRVVIEGNTLLVRFAAPGGGVGEPVTGAAAKASTAVEARVTDVRFEHTELEDRVRVQVS